MEYKEVELFIDEEGRWLDKISLVDVPAIETDFLCFNKEQELKFSANDEKRIITGPAMIPEKRMWRNEGFYVYFSEDTIRKCAYRWLKEDMNHQFNLNHNNNTSSVSVIESWIVEDSENDKSAALGFNLPKGTWMVSCKIDDENLWADIKSGKFNGFSVEGLFTFYKDFKSEDEQIIEEAEEFVRSKCV